MALTLTETAKSRVNQTTKEPNIVFEIEGVGTVFGASLIQKYVEIGDEDLIIGDPELNDDAFYIGGFNFYGDQENIISFDGTSTSIRQQLNVDKGEGGSVSKLAISLIETDFVLKLLTPGEVVDDVLNRRCKVYFGFNETAFPQDYITIFRGFISDIEADAGKVVFDISHPDEKKRSNIYKKIDSNLSGAINSSVTTIPLTTVDNMLVRVLGPLGTYDPAFKSYVRIGDEIIQYTGISGLSLTGCTRAQFNTVAAAHASNDSVTTFYRLNDNGVKLALKLMASGADPFEDVEPQSIGYVDGDLVANSIYFDGIDLKETYGLNVGDFVSSAGSAAPANNFTNRAILDIVISETGNYLIVDGASLTPESMTTALISFRSQYDTLPDGLNMMMDEIDVAEHLRIFSLFLSTVEYDIYLKDTIEDAKEFVEKEIYSPMAAYSLPRKARASMGYHIGPIPGADIKTFDKTNIKNPSKQKLKRSISNQFYNEIFYQFDESALEEKFQTGYLAISATSKNRIKGANKTLVIESKGLRSLTSGQAIAQVQSLRRLKRYEFGAETIEFSALLDDSFTVEIGDIIIYDGTDLQLPNTKTGTKGIEARFYEVQQKGLQLRTGDVSFMAVDTGFSGTARYGLISPSSEIASVISTNQFVIKNSFSMNQGPFEYRKWEKLFGPSKNPVVRIRNSDFSFDEITTITGISGNLITVASITLPSAGMIMELAPYDQTPTDQVKLLYAFMSPLTGDPNPYVML